MSRKKRKKLVRNAKQMTRTELELAYAFAVASLDELRRNVSAAWYQFAKPIERFDRLLKPRRR
jgi:hypothetical protein